MATLNAPRPAPTFSITPALASAAITPMMKMMYPTR